MVITEKKQNNILIVEIEGRLDSSTSGELEQKLQSCITNSELRIIVDFGKLDYISSAGLRVLLSTAKKMKSSGGKLRICSMKDFIREIFDISGFSNVLSIDKTLEEALLNIA